MMDRDAFDALPDADKLSTLYGLMLDIAEMLLAEIVEDAFPEPQGSA
jgi:hypothetical protein